MPLEETQTRLAEVWASYERGDYTGAERVLRDLLRLRLSAQAERAALNALGFVLTAQKRFPEGRRIFDELFSQSGSHRYLHNLVMLEREAGRYREALELTLQERKLLPDDALAWAANLYEEGVLLEHLGEFGSALSVAERCLNHSEASADLVMQGCAQRLLGDLARHHSNQPAQHHYERARRFFEAAILRRSPT